MYFSTRSPLSKGERQDLIKEKKLERVFQKLNMKPISEGKKYNLQISRSVANRVNYFFLLSFLRIKKQFNMI
jgi:hypothetical protein